MVTQTLPPAVFMLKILRLLIPLVDVLINRLQTPHLFSVIYCVSVCVGSWYLAEWGLNALFRDYLGKAPRW